MQYKPRRQTMLRNPWNGTFVHHCCCPKHTIWHQHSKKNTNVKLVDTITADIQEAQHDNVCLTQRIAVRCTIFYLITLKMQLVTMCTSREELQFYFVHLCFTQQVKDHPTELQQS
jgi:hypothetical protein